MYPFIDHEPEKFLSEVDRLKVRFQGFLEDGKIHQDYHYREKAPTLVLSTLNTFEGTMTCKVPLNDSVRELFATVRRVGTLMELNKIKIHQDGSISAGNIKLSNEEYFRFQVRAFENSKKGIHVFEGQTIQGKIDRDPQKLEGSTIHVGLTGAQGKALKDFLLASKGGAPSVELYVSGLTEIKPKLFIKTESPAQEPK